MSMSHKGGQAVLQPVRKLCSLRRHQSTVRDDVAISNCKVIR
jgi:hypothetical protein